MDSKMDVKRLVEFNNSVLSLTQTLANSSWPKTVKFEKGKEPAAVHQAVSKLLEDEESDILINYLAPYVVEWKPVVVAKDATAIKKLPGNIASVVGQIWNVLDDDSKDGMWEELQNICDCFDASKSWVSDQQKLQQLEQKQNQSLNQNSKSAVQKKQQDTNNKKPSPASSASASNTKPSSVSSSSTKQAPASTDNKTTKQAPASADSKTTKQAPASTDSKTTKQSLIKDDNKTIKQAPVSIDSKTNNQAPMKDDNKTTTEKKKNNSNASATKKKRRNKKLSNTEMEGQDFLKDIPAMLGGFMKMAKDPNMEKNPHETIENFLPSNSVFGKPLQNIMKRFIPNGSTGGVQNANELLASAKTEEKAKPQETEVDAESKLTSLYSVFNLELNDLFELVVEYRTKKFQDQIPEFQLLHLILQQAVQELGDEKNKGFSKYAVPIIESVRKHKEMWNKYADELDSPVLWSDYASFLPEMKHVPMNILIKSIQNCQTNNKFRVMLREKMAQIYSRVNTIINLKDKYSSVIPIVGDILTQLESSAAGKDGEEPELEIGKLIDMVASEKNLAAVAKIGNSMPQSAQEDEMKHLLGSIFDAGVNTTNKNKEEMKKRMEEIMSQGKDLANKDAKQTEEWMQNWINQMKDMTMSSAQEDDESSGEEDGDEEDEEEFGEKNNAVDKKTRSAAANDVKQQTQKSSHVTSSSSTSTSSSSSTTTPASTAVSSSFSDRTPINNKK